MRVYDTRLGRKNEQSNSLEYLSNTFSPNPQSKSSLRAVIVRDFKSAKTFASFYNPSDVNGCPDDMPFDRFEQATLRLLKYEEMK